MLNSYLFPVTSVETLHFTEGLAAAGGIATPPYAASVMYNIPGVPRWGSRKFLVRSLLVVSVQAFGPEINFFDSAVGPTLNPATDNFIARFGFTTAMGEQIGGAGLYRYYVDGLAIPYVDMDTFDSDASPTLHLIMQNIDTTAKLAGELGYVTVTTWLEAMAER